MVTFCYIKHKVVHHGIFKNLWPLNLILWPWPWKCYLTMSNLSLYKCQNFGNGYSNLLPHMIVQHSIFKKNILVYWNIYILNIRCICICKYTTPIPHIQAQMARLSGLWPSFFYIVASIYITQRGRVLYLGQR